MSAQSIASAIPGNLSSSFIQTPRLSTDAAIVLISSIGLLTLIGWAIGAFEKPLKLQTEEEIGLRQQLVMDYAEIQKAGENSAKITRIENVDSKIVQVNQDGSCLYHSFIAHLRFNGVEHLPTPDNLRRHVYEFLKKKVEEGNDLVKGLLNISIEEHNEACALKIRPGDYSTYLNRIRGKKFFGGGAEFYALSELYRVPIYVYSMLGNSANLISQYNCESTNAPIPFVFSPGIPHYDLLTL